MADSIKLNNIDLPINMIWADRHSAPRVAQQMKQTIGGNAVVYATQIFKGIPITLVASQDSGWLSGAQVAAIEALAMVPGGIYNLYINMDSKGTIGQPDYIAGYTINQNVMFRHQDTPAFEMTPIIPRLSERVGDWFTGTIKLIMV
jgi:hypothetical protein